MPYNILLLPLLGGYVFVSRWYWTRWYVRRAEKERLIIYAALAGSLHLAIAFAWLFLFPLVIQLYPSMLWIETVHVWWRTNVPFPYSGTAILAFIVGIFGWIPLNAISDLWFGGKPWPWPKDQRKGKDAAAERVIRDYGGPLEQTLFKSLELDKHVMLTLDNGKVYIGIVAAMFTPDDKIIYLWPQQSGHRDTKQRLSMTTRYDKAYSKMAEGEENYKEIIKDFRVAIPVDRMISATAYSDEIRERYFPHQTPDEPLDME